MQQKPSIGRTVHYQSPYTGLAEYLYDQETAPSVIPPTAAIITKVWEAFGDEGLVDLCLFTSTEVKFIQRVPFREQPKANHWSWTPLV